MNPVYPHAACPHCPWNRKPIMGDGPQPNPLLFIGEGPARDEVKVGLPFMGRAGKEFNLHYLPLAGLVRPEVRTDNATHCLRGDARVVLPDGRSRPVSHLYKTGYDGVVQCLDNGKTTTGRVLRCIKSPRDGRKFYRLRFSHYRAKGHHQGGTILTEDHRVLTDHGYIPVSELKTGDCIATGSPGLSLRQLKFLVGTLLGDGWIVRRSLHIQRPSRETEYLAFQSRLFQNLGGSIQPTYNGNKTVTPEQPVLEYIRESWGRDFIEQYFSATSLATWFLDDGCREIKQDGSTRCITIRCKRLPDSDINWLCSLLLYKTGVRCNPGKGRIYVCQESWDKLLALVGLFAPGCMRYKLPPDSPPFYEALYTPDYETFWDSCIVEPCGNRQGSNEHSVYCLTTTHGNFRTVGGVVHNCPMPNYDNPSHQMARECSLRHLPQELRHTQPELIVLMGGVACSLADTHIDLDVDHGLPQHNSLLDGLWEGMVFPTFHPAAGLHEGQMILQLRQDFANLGQYLKGKLVAPVDAHPNPQRRLLRGAGDVYDVIPDPEDQSGDGAVLEVAIDTESVSLHGAPWCLSFAVDPDHGYVILADDDSGLREFQDWIEDARPQVILHHSLHDIPVLRAMGVEVTRWRDTMVDAYHLADVPQGLKALGWRLLGVRMKSFEDTVLPHSMPVAIEYVAAAASQLEAAFTFEHQLKSGPRKGQYETRPLPGVDKSAMGTLRKLQKILKEDGADPWQRWAGWHDHDRELLRGMMGTGMPQPSIVHVPLEEAVEYAALDAIVTLRVHHELRKRRIAL